MLRLPTGRKRPANAGDGEVERQAAGRSRRVEAVELVLAVGTRRVAPGQRAHEEKVVACPVRERRGVGKLLNVERRQEDVMQHRVVRGGHQQKVLVPAAAVGVRDPERQPEQVRYRTRQADSPRKPGDRAVLAPAREELGGLRSGRGARDRQSGVVHHAIGVKGLAAPDGGEHGHHRADRYAGGLSEGALPGFGRRIPHCEPVRPRRGA